MRPATTKKWSASGCGVALSERSRARLTNLCSVIACRMLAGTVIKTSPVSLREGLSPRLCTCAVGGGGSVPGEQVLSGHVTAARPEVVPEPAASADAAWVGTSAWPMAAAALTTASGSPRRVSRTASRTITRSRDISADTYPLACSGGADETGTLRSCPTGLARELVTPVGG